MNILSATVPFVADGRLPQRTLATRDYKREGGSAGSPTVVRQAHQPWFDPSTRSGTDRLINRCCGP